ncbi:XrtA/PEP-CTERM system amidotransferase [Sphingomonas prati]|uniref:asparagine synthase (glutamine-hydrolyzing) n=1 Tax=Sphingomonas prati TaxID=1843237 RepID=A0A7W9F0P4_9SPHN|nr:XrtA/PEP-CTERM system amidotransferase [Sphingomonas prati]MBB5728597.1 asparagine synthase (glutamine-hydrolyzing) [Sphingomonas prati]GGE72559.1 amidotransferase 1, exosortase A system-associated [Sphingomonas prati]
MCGIAGIFHRETAKPVDPARVRGMTDAIAHRGPDGAGVWTGSGVGLGHRRLAIIDPTPAGAQPMLLDHLTIVFNGEIYNFAEVRAELSLAGHRFHTDCDTEVILHAYRKWGPACLDRFNGMFAFALHDAAENTLFLARDRFGVKPLFYATLSDGALLFASELKAILAHPLFRAVPDLTAIDDYLAYGYVPDDACIVAGVSKLPAGHHMLVRRGQPLPAPTKWYQLSFADRATGSVAALTEELDARLRDAVRSRMVADVPLGAFLSGGVDSSGVVAMMAEASPHAVQTCSIGFDSAGYDETRYARIVADRFATDHRERTVAAGDFGLIDTLVAAYDEPFADASALPTYRVCELARETVTVALSGDGADEAFAGYRRHAFHAAEERVRGLIPARLREPVFGRLGAAYPKLAWAPQVLRAKSTLQSLGQSGAEAYATAVGITSHADRHALYAPGFARSLSGHRAEDRYVKAMTDAPARDPIDRAQYADMQIWLPGDILTKVDRASMAVSLEAREPLLDHRLVEFAARLPASMRLHRGQGKWLLKKALARRLPDEILYRRKMGFVTPITAWFRGPLAAEAQRIGEGSALSATGWFDGARLKSVADDHRSGRADHGRLLWQLLMLEKSLTRLFGVA